VHRARETPGKTVFAGAFLALFLVLVFWSFGLVLALLAAIVLFVALHTYFLPITYTFDITGVRVDKRVFNYTYPWDRFRRFVCASGGIVLSPFSARTFLDNFRGVHLLLPADPSPVVAYLARRFPPQENLDTEPAEDMMKRKEKA